MDEEGFKRRTKNLGLRVIRLVEADLMPHSRLADLTDEASQILAMTVASIKTLCAKGRNQSPIYSPQSKIES